MSTVPAELQKPEPPRYVRKHTQHGLTMPPRDWAELCRIAGEESISVSALVRLLLHRHIDQAAGNLPAALIGELPTNNSPD